MWAIKGHHVVATATDAEAMPPATPGSEPLLHGRLFSWLLYDIGPTRMTFGLPDEQHPITLGYYGSNTNDVVGRSFFVCCAYVWHVWFKIPLI
jgi:hypothetical protein